MSLGSLLQKEIHWSTRNVLILLFLLLLLPLFFAGTSVMFQDVIPRSVPVAVVAADEAVTEDDVTIVEGGLAPFTDPTVVENQDKAARMLERESVYGIVEVPANITTEGAEAEFTLTIDGSIVPFQAPSEVIQSLMAFQLDRLLAADISVEREVIGEEKDLPEYLFPTFLMTLLIFFAFTYVPYNLKNETKVLDRLQVESSLEALVTAKLIFLTLLMLLPILLFYVAAIYYRYDIEVIAPGAILALLLTFLLLATASMTVMVLTRFSGVGQFINIVVMLGLIGLSGLAFPLGFFSSIRTTVAQLLPTHYTMIITRSMMLKDGNSMLFFDWFVGIIVLLLIAGLALKGSIVHYRRTS